MNSFLCAPTRDTTVRCRIAARAVLRGGAEEIAQGRRQPVVVGGEKLPVSFLKNADDQTVLGLSSVLVTIAQQGWHDRSFAAWGVIAAPNLFGRTVIAQTLQRFQQEGAWCVSPHLIPQTSLHAMSGTISQALKIYGPNFGISGGPNAALDAFLAAGALMMDGDLPGLWLVLTGYETEFLPTARAAPPCHAIALALTPVQGDTRGPHLSIGHFSADTKNDLSVAGLPELQIHALAEELSGHMSMARGKWRLGDSHWLELEPPLLTGGVSHET